MVIVFEDNVIAGNKMSEQVKIILKLWKKCNHRFHDSFTYGNNEACVKTCVWFVTYSCKP